MLLDAIRAAWIAAEGREAYEQRVAIAVEALTEPENEESEEQYRERRRAEIAQRQAVAARRLA